LSGRLGWLLGWRVFRGQLGPHGDRFLRAGTWALALGLVPLVLVLSIADGMIEGISSRTIETLLSHVQAWPMTVSPGDDLPFRLRSVPGFRGAFAERQGFALAYSEKARLGINLRGIDRLWAEDPGVKTYLKAVEGALVFSRPRSAWLGKEAAQKLGLRVGDTFKILTTRTSGTVRVPRVTSYTVGAVVSVGYQELDKLWVFVPLDEAERVLDPDESAVFWGIKSDLPLAQTASFLVAVRQTLGFDWQVESWETTGRSQFLNYQATRWLLLIVMALILLVSAVNISTAMVTLVQQRRQETAVLKALGATGGLIRGQFVVLGLLAGVFGTLAGLGLGVAVALGINGLMAAVELVLGAMSALRGWLTGSVIETVRLLDPAYYLETLPVKFDLPLLGLVAAGSITLSVVASVIPAWKASNQRPLEVLRRT